MAIATITVDWLLRLKKKGVFDDRPSLLELGPQDFELPLPHLMHRLGRLGLGADHADKLSQDGRYKPYAVQTLYEALGVRHYTAGDSVDPRRHIHLDLNYPVKDIEKKYNLITDFGTLEHVFNIGQAFVNIDKMIADNGIVLHILPAMGDINHGFYHINPTMYLDIAAANGYDIIDFLYIDNVYVREQTLRESENICNEFNFDSLPVKINASNVNARFHEVNPEFNIAAAACMFNNTASSETRAFWGKHPTVLFDHCYVAMRKIPSHAERVFHFPTQSIYR